MFNISKKDFRKIDKLLVASIIFLVGFGLIVLNSAVAPLGDKTMKSQLISTGIGIFFIFFLYLIDLEFFKRIKWLIYIASIALLLATYFLSIGADTWGANSWLKIGSIVIQPSEILKITIIIFLAAYLDEKKSVINEPLELIKFLILAFIPVIFIAMEPDFGTAMVYTFVIAALLFVNGIDWKYIGIAFVLVLLLIPIIWMNLEPYQKNRVLNFKDPEADVTMSGLQQERGYVAIGSGKFSGKGYKKGSMAQNNFIPEHHTDYIFSVAAEEFGFIGGTAILLSYLLMLLRLMNLSKKTNNRFEFNLVIGFTAMFFVHIFENIAMTMRLMPVTGIPLPFFSYGGTFQMVNLVAVGIILSVNMQREALSL